MILIGSHLTISKPFQDLQNLHPHFSYWPQTVYSDDVSESLPEGTDILEVMATDEDAGDNGVIVFSLSGDDAALFAINENTGKVILKKRN